MIIDLDKQRNGRSNAQRTFAIGAAYRTAKNDHTWGPWVNTHEEYAVVTAQTNIGALETYLRTRPDLAEHAARSWVFSTSAMETMATQRVWLVRALDDVGNDLPQHESDALYLNGNRDVPQHILLMH